MLVMIYIKRNICSTSIDSAFDSCESDTPLDVSNFDTNNVTNIRNMFDKFNNLKTIFIDLNWNIDKADTSSM